ncbi:unnamed protein product [Rotaria magnacalcarata]|uniref:Uncharacterized protein n=1 Tax=Rotaria magnacalcarata TaxID=392030 RepID=A0A816H5R2_9BILA|nr:unnamed protein product [Rotaria magnacalcarata]
MSGKRALLNMDEAAKTIVNCITSMKTEYYGKLIDFNSGNNCWHLQLIFATHRQSDRFEELFALAKKNLENIIPVQLDITDDISVRKVVEQVKQTLNGRDLSCLINNAGTTAFLPLLEKSASQLEQPDIKQSSVINISSIMSSLELVKSLPYYYDDYQCSKVALNMLTICMEMDTDKAPLTIVAAAKNILECLQAMINEQHCKLIDTSDGKN